ncbi:hydroxycarboxylic acid receptor 1-like [Carcharodon carcharias]|uniref:hydroxycarboxylic acid receptor 1-like n=1 Tax=Carcharodon carcharias TaxID=13397 RepID=UPI001B7D9D1D|nr:hydroxycarboxylic acid receptor 1-like [Carcharodon carcharias]
MVNGNQQCVFEKDVNSSYNPPIIIISCILGFIGNAIALWIFSFHVKCWKPNTVYSLNLAIADTLLISCLPFRADYFLREKNWIFGDVPCRLKVFFISLNRVGSIMFLTVMAIDRYFKVVQPHHRVNKIHTNSAVKLAGILWILTTIACSHLLAESHGFPVNNLTYCEPFDMSKSPIPTTIWTYVLFVVFMFAFPASVILFSTTSIIWKLQRMDSESRGKYKRAVKLVIAVAAVFVFCFLPTNIAVIAVLITKPKVAEDCKSYEIAVQAFYNTLFMTYLNSALDPVIYYFSSSTFKASFMKALAPLNLNCFGSASRRSTQRREHKREIVVGQIPEKIPDRNACDQSQSDITLTATSNC